MNIEVRTDRPYTVTVERGALDRAGELLQIGRAHV